MHLFARFAALCLPLLAIGASARAADAPIAWVQFAADGAASLRAIAARGAACPAITVDGAAVAAQARIAPDDAFPVQICEAKLPPAAKSVAVAGRPVPVVSQTVKRVAVIGDTGCRIEGRAVQDCRSPTGWPFAAIAKAAAAKQPDLVIHVGDYYYRENACPAAAAAKCADSPFGDKWATWQAEFFDPAAPLLAAAPWVMIRGNHESCKRGGRGWFRLLDPYAARGDCVETTPPYRVSVGGLELLPFDNADADDFLAPPDKVKTYEAQFASLLANAPAHSWLLTHRPVWAQGQDKLSALRVNLTMQQAIREHIPPGLELVISGHLHDFLSYEFGPARPAQMIVGTGGDTLLKLADADIVGAEIDGMTVRKSFGTARFGYFIMDRAGDGWDGVLYAPDDAVLGRCHLAGRQIDCH